MTLKNLRDALPSVKPFKSKNRDKIDLDATNPNLKKFLIEIFSSNKILPMKFYSSSLELFTLKIHIIV